MLYPLNFQYNKVYIMTSQRILDNDSKSGTTFDWSKNVFIFTNSKALNNIHQSKFICIFFWKITIVICWGEN